MDYNRCSFRRFFAGYFVFLSITLTFALFLSSVSFVSVPLKATMSVDMSNKTNSTIRNVRMWFYVRDFQNDSRIRFFNITSSTIQTPNDTLIEPIEDGSGFAVYMPEWRSGEEVRFLVDDINVTSDLPIDFSSLGYFPISYRMSNASWSSELNGAVLTIIGKTFFGTSSVASLNQFTYNGVPQPAERRIQATEYVQAFFVLLYFSAVLIPLSIWIPWIMRRLPVATFMLALLMVFLYAFVGSGREILAMPPFPCNNLKIWPFGIFMHVDDAHIFGNLMIFIPMSLLLEVWLNVKNSRRKFLIWYALPILVAMIPLGIGFSISNEILAWALWSLIVVKQLKTTTLNLVLSIFSGVMAYVFFGWLFQYLLYVFSQIASTWWGQIAKNHIFWGLVGAVVFGLITLVEMKKETVNIVFKKGDIPSKGTEESHEKNRRPPRDLSEREKVRLQRLVSELSSRENSTLVFSTVTTSTSLAILVLALEPARTQWFGLAFWMGLLFSLTGFLYREATVFGIDSENYREVRALLTISGETYYELDKRTRSLNFFRMIIIRFFLLVPTGSWILVAFNVQAVGWTALTYFMLLGVAVSLSLLECEERQDHP